ncbi:MAG: malto-oligosyltrehalose synthase [Frankiaceae bacterium]
MTDPRHLPAPGRPVPTGTYRLQLHRGFTFDDAAAQVGYLADLGVSHLYLSPCLQAVPGSTHGYDVIDHSRLNEDLGGEPAFARLVAAAHAAGMGLVVDVVPNHMAVSEPESQNAAWWSVLREGTASPFAGWFDIDWHDRDNPGRVLVPVLGAGLDASLPELTVAGDRVRYYDHEVPLAPGTAPDEAGDPAQRPGQDAASDLAAALARQHYRLCHWRVAGEELNYRRFFDITTLAGLRVEDRDVYEQTHAVLVRHVRTGAVDGLRIDHPDGLADPQAYLQRVAADTDGAWVVAEKILEGSEQLPAAWRCVGTTGYDALNQITGLFVDPRAEAPFTELYEDLTGHPGEYRTVEAASKRHVVAHVLAAEVNRLTERLTSAAWAQPATRDLTRRGIREALVALLSDFEVYRAYVRPGEPVPESTRRVVEAACERARAAVPSRAAELEAVGRLVLHGPADVVVAFQQVCGPVMAKGVEDTTFYRYGRLLALNEVGGDPGRFGRSVADFHRFCADLQSDWPLTMTTLSTHDTKRSEDVRARLCVLTEDAAGWADLAARVLAAADRHVSAAGPSRHSAYFLLQTLVGAWPVSAERAVAYMEKASREAKLHTSWTDPDATFEEALRRYVHAVLADDEIRTTLTGYVAALAPAARVTSLAQKLIQLTMPGVPDVYQGSETQLLALVDPDNRRPVDFARLAGTLHALTGDEQYDGKQQLVAAALRLRRARPDCFGPDAGYEPLHAGGSGAEHVVAFARGGRVVTVAPRLALTLARRGGWRDTVLTLPPGRWVDVVTGTAADGTTQLTRLLGRLPVVLLTRSA